MYLLNFIKTNVILILIFATALFLRTYQLGDFPVGLHGDEASIGYNAYSIFQTHKDQDGKNSLAIDQFGDFRPAGYHYIDAPFIGIFGVNETAVRLPAALFGSLNVLLVYFLVSFIFKRKQLALLSAGLLAILPWDINISRATSESIIAAFFVTLGVILLLIGIEKKGKNFIYFILSTIFVLTSFLFYHAARYFTILIIPSITLVTFLNNKKKAIAPLIITVFVFIGLIFFLSVGKGTGRVSEVSLLSIPGGTTALKHAMDQEGTANPLITRFYSNKLLYYGRFFITFYSQHLSGDFLFVNTGLPIRYLIPQTGNLYLVQAPFLILGLAFLIYEGLKNKKYNYLIPIIWLFLAPIPAGLTWEDLPNVQRSMFMIIPLVIISAFGFYEFINMLNKKIKYPVIIFCALLLAYGFLIFYHNYFWRMKIEEPWHRGYAAKELVVNIQIITQQNPKAKFIMTAQNYNNFIFYLFFSKFDPKRFQELGSPKEHDGLQFENLTYLNDSCPLKEGMGDTQMKDPNLYFVNKPDCPLPSNAEVLNVIRTSDGIPALNLIKIRQNEK